MKHDPTSASRALAALGLQRPLRQRTRHQLDERRVLGMWQGIERRSRPGSERRWWSLTPVRLAFAACLMLALVLGWSVLRTPSPGMPPGPLVTAEGQRFESIDAAGQHAERVAFADGSHIEAAPGARIEGLAATANEFVLLLRRGQARFSVAPGGARRWLIEARGASVEVVGTVFSVASEPSSFSVDVEQGVVLVRSPLLADGVQRLSAGQALRLALGELDLGEKAADPELEAAPPPDGPQGAAPARPQRKAERSRGKAASSSARAESDTAPPRAAQPAREPAPDSAQQLWARADGARRLGDAARAAQLLGRLIDEYPRDSQAGLAAYTLGVLQLEQLAAPRSAAQRFGQALELGIASELRESCYLRRAEALHHAGDEAAARQVARRYLREYPLGEHRDAMQRLIMSLELRDGTRAVRGGRPR